MGAVALRLPDGVREGLQAQQQRQRAWARAKSRRRWIRKPRAATRERYLRLCEMALDGSLDDAGALELGQLSRRLPNAIKRAIERRGRQAALFETP